MIKPWLLRFHRWVALLFALPLLGVFATGLVLSVEPLVSTLSIKPGSVNAASVEALLQRHDPDGKARGLMLRPYENTLWLTGDRRAGPTRVDLATGEVAAGGTRLSDVFGTARRWHEHLIFEGSWLVEASSFAMLALIPLGLLLGWPRLRHTLAGWHKGMAWLPLPLLVLSPLTGLLMAYGVTFAPTPPPEGRAAPIPLREAVRLVGEGHDLSGLIWLRGRGGALLARINEGGEARIYRVVRDGVVLQPRNWPRLIHEGTISGIWGSVANLVTALALLGLLGTGGWLWLRRQVRRFGRRRSRAAEPAAA